MKRLFFIVFFLLSLTVQAQTLLIFGGRDHKVFLGCLNCSEYDSSSVWNEYGNYGSPYGSRSIWNEYGEYGSEYGNYSPWNEYALYPPVVVDAEGNFYGYLTVNDYHIHQADFELARLLYRYYKLIRENPGKWYEKIFE